MTHAEIQKLWNHGLTPYWDSQFGHADPSRIMAEAGDPNEAKPMWITRQYLQSIFKIRWGGIVEGADPGSSDPVTLLLSDNLHHIKIHAGPQSDDNYVRLHFAPINDKTPLEEWDLVNRIGWDDLHGWAATTITRWSKTIA